MLKKSENLIEFSFKQLVMQSRLASSIFRPRSGYVLYVKNEM